MSLYFTFNKTLYLLQHRSYEYTYTSNTTENIQIITSIPIHSNIRWNKLISYAEAVGSPSIVNHSNHPGTIITQIFVLPIKNVARCIKPLYIVYVIKFSLAYARESTLLRSEMYRETASSLLSLEKLYES